MHSAGHGLQLVLMASFNVEQFEDGRVAAATQDEVEARLGELRAMTHFADA